MKLSSFAKYLKLRVINTEMPGLVVALAAIFLLSADPVSAQDEISKPSKNVAQAKWIRGDVAGVPEEKFRILGEAARLRYQADSIERHAKRAVIEAGEAMPENKERMKKGAAVEVAKAKARSAQADSLLLILVRDEDQARATPDVIAASSQADLRQLSQFEIRHAPAYSDSNPVPVDPAMPEGLIYTVQIAAFRNMVTPSLFKGLFPVFGITRQGSDAVYYYAGLFRRLNDAREALPEARAIGFPDAFIIAMMDGVQVSMERALLIEKEWSAQPLYGNNNATGTQSKQPDKPLPVGTLSFRAEVMRINKPVKPDVIQKIELLAGTRGLEMIKNNNGETVVLIGNFITFESADEYVSLLIRNGYSLARVAAYVGRQEIPVDAANELINKLPDD